MKKLVLLSVAIGLLAASPALATPLKPGDILLEDPLRGTFVIDPTTGAATQIIPTNQADIPFGNATDLTFDRQGGILVADPQAGPLSKGAITRLVPDGPGSVVSLEGPFVDPGGIALDPAGNIVVADRNAGTGGTIFRFLPGASPGGLATGPPLADPQSVAIDHGGNIVIADRNSDPNGTGTIPGAVLRIPAAGGPATVVVASSQFKDPFGVAVDAADDIVMADFQAQTVFRIPLGGVPTPLATGSPLVSPADVAVDAHGGILIADSGANPKGLPGNQGAVFRIPPGGGPPVLLSEEELFQDPEGIAVVPPQCRGRYATLYGDDQDNLLRGTGGADVIVGGLGKDTIQGLGGNDVICGEDGKDKLKGGGGRDLLSGGPSADRLIGGKGKDRCLGEAGRDRARKCEKTRSAQAAA